jgi:hypothetical protein
MWCNYRCQWSAPNYTKSANGLPIGVWCPYGNWKARLLIHTRKGPARHSDDRTDGKIDSGSLLEGIPPPSSRFRRNKQRLTGEGRRLLDNQHFGPQLCPVQGGTSIATHLPSPLQNCLTPAFVTQDAPRVQAAGFAAAFAVFFFAASDEAAERAIATTATVPTSRIFANDFMTTPSC